jgi:hypothetical protein
LKTCNWEAEEERLGPDRGVSSEQLVEGVKNTVKDPAKGEMPENIKITGSTI